MASYDVKNLDGQKVGEVELDDAVFAADVKEHLLWAAVRHIQAKKRAGTHSTLRRDEVRGGGKKPWRQKGTGRARSGSSRSPVFVGGGSTFGPKPRDYEHSLPKKMRAGAMRSVLSLRAKESKLVIVDEFKLAEIKTKRVISALAALGAPKALVVDGANENLALSIRNLPEAKYVALEGVNVYEVLRHENLVLTRETALALQERLRPMTGGVA